jgi:lipopolysaccharide/colanic/teichoic acid biosynthesis glycosyltransferase
MSTVAVPNPNAGSADARRLRVRARAQRTAKRMLDLCGAAFLLALFAPLILVLALLVKLGDGGPVFYRRRVVGRGGEFDAFKLRTMRTDADTILRHDPQLRAEYEQNFKLRDDPRVTRVGGVLRRYSLDELPQLFNVLMGTMSLVGPRMITAPELTKYGDRKEILMRVKPGLTGYWQVNGRQETSYAERIHMDTYYVENWSFWLDVKILLLTPLKVLKGEGAY